MGRRRAACGASLVAAEFALATPLLVAGALVLQSLDRLSHVPVGIDTARVLTAGVSLSGPRYAREADRQAFWKRTLERLAALPAVEAAAIADSRPPDEAGNLNNFDLEDHPAAEGQNQPVCPWVGASPGFFKTVGLTARARAALRRARHRGDDAPVIVVDRAWADRFFPGQNVRRPPLPRGRLHDLSVDDGDRRRQHGQVRGPRGARRGHRLHPVRRLPERISGPSHRQAIPRGRADAASGDAGAGSRRLPLSDVATGDELVADALVTPRYLSVLIGMFALTALVLSIVGIYGVMAYFVQQHTRDIGIRLALGGEPSAMRRMVVRAGPACWSLVGVAARRGCRAAGGPAADDRAVRRDARPIRGRWSACRSRS